MTDAPSFHAIPVPAGLQPSAGPYVILDDGTVKSADGRVFAVLGYPEAPLTARDVVNGRLLQALPKLLAAAHAVRAVRPVNWDDDEDAEQAAAWRALDAALDATGTMVRARQQNPRSKGGA